MENRRAPLDPLKFDPVLCGAIYSSIIADNSRAGCGWTGIGCAVEMVQEDNALGRVLAYDLIIIWKGFRAAFSKKRDVMVLLLAVPILLLLAVQGASNVANTVRYMPELSRMLLVSFTAFFTELAVDRRLAHLESESIVARLALRRGQRLLHRLFWNAPPLFASVTIMAAGTASSAPLAVRVVALVLTYAAGVGAGTLARRARRNLRRWRARRVAALGAARSLRLEGEERRQRIAALVAARTGLAGPSVAANAALFAALGALVALAYHFLLGALPRPGPEVIAGLAALVALGLLLRQHPPLLRYLLYLGVEPTWPALVPAVSALSLGAGFVLGAAAMNLAQSPALAAVAAAAVLLFTVLALLRALHFATKSRQAAELAMQIDAVVILVAGFAAVPVAPVLLVARLVLLHRRARKLRFVVAP